MLKKINISWVLFLCTLILNSPVKADDAALFNAVAPDALFILDLSGSMNWTPAGGIMYTLTGQPCNSTINPFYSNSDTGHTTACSIDPYGSIPKFSTASCADPYYRTSSGSRE